ncbi:MAG: sugar-binding transcriptional regulator [Anaerolineales bacterium]
MSDNDVEQSLLFKVAQAYYLEGATQEEIGRRFGLSRIKVSRLLKRARDEHVVQITVAAPSGSLAEAEQQLANHLGLDELVIADINAFDGPTVTRALGAAAAPVLLRHLDGRATLAVSAGSALSAVVDALPRRVWPQVTVVQMLGGVGRADAETQGADIVRRLAATLGARPQMLASPGIVATRQVRDALLSDPQVFDTLSRAAGAQVALVGIGIPAQTSSRLGQGAILTAADVDELAAHHAVGDIALRFFDGDGQLVHTSLDQRIIGLEHEQIRRIPCVIAVAGGMAKLAAIRAVLKGHLANVLVTDVYVARRILEEVERGQL